MSRQVTHWVGPTQANQSLFKQSQDTPEFSSSGTN